MGRNVELARLECAEAALPAVAARYDDVLAAPDAPRRLWQRAVDDVGSGRVDDRPLYWARLKLLRDRHHRGATPARIERRSRGFDIAFPAGEPGVLLTGFDPFHLDRDIGQSNPSGVAALALHGARIAGANVRAAILPVRFAAFDDGVVERLLTPVFRQPETVFALTISMGRDQMDLERFPGRRRSARTADNRGVRSGASPECPLAPRGLAGPEFLEFTLPAAAMAGAPGRWRVCDNRRVTTLERGAVVAGSLGEIAHHTAVAGSSGGFLSNEVAYRSLLLRQRLGGRFSLGHLHTPAIRGHDGDVLTAMVAQIRRIVEAGVAARPRPGGGRV